MILRWPVSISSRTVRRNMALPSPREMRPLKSTMAMSPTCRLVPCNATSCLTSQSIRVAEIGNCTGQTLGHDHFGSAALPWRHAQFVHERPHEKNAAARGAKQVFLGQTVGNLSQNEALPLVEYSNNHFLRVELNRYLDLLFGVLLVAIIIRVYDALSNSHANLVGILVAKARGFSDTHHNALGKVDALKLRFERYVDTLG